LIFQLNNINLKIIISLMSNTQSVKAVAKYIRMSPHKIRRVLDQIRGRSYQEALMILEFLPYDASVLFGKLFILQQQMQNIIMD
jgi:ribosomal protein L22